MCQTFARSNGHSYPDEIVSTFMELKGHYISLQIFHLFVYLLFATFTNLFKNILLNFYNIFEYHA